jgi:hypothetical protein
MYFNPASMVKMPLAFLSLEKLNRLNIAGVNKYTNIQFDSSQPWQTAMHNDSGSKGGLPSIAHLIKRAFLISENDPYNRMYQFVGQQDINRILHAKGYKNVRITRQFLGLKEDQNRYSNPIRFLGKNNELLYQQNELVNKDSFDFPSKILMGNAYLNNKDSLVNEPFDFTRHNYLSLETMQQLLQSILFPQSVPQKQRFKLTKDDFSFLYRYLSQFPSETSYPKYDTAEFYDSYVKFFFRDSTKHIPSYVRVFNKVGWAYGFSTDISYIVDFKNKVEFMLAATIYVNSDGVINDDKYDYETVAQPFLYQLGQTIYQYELNRKRNHKPDLSSFRIKYEKRDPADTKPVIKQVNN